MAAFRNKENGSWYVQFRYTDWTGERKQKFKRGFATKREAQEWERAFLMQKRADLQMEFGSFVELYIKDMQPKLRVSTWINKESIIKQKILPYFAKRKMAEITPKDILDWQNEMRKLRNQRGEPYSDAYLRNLHTQINAIFSHAVKYYNLQVNPVTKAGSMGNKDKREMQFWTKEEYLKFSEAMMDKPVSFYAFEVLYWCGLRQGELLALTPQDFDFQENTLTIRKSYQRLQGKDVVTAPKTPKGKRTIQIPKFLSEEIQDYIQQSYGMKPDMRLFPITKYYLRREMQRGCQETGVKRIKIHGLRHSAVSLLIDMGFSALAIAERVGHESTEITYRYAHLFPDKQKEMAAQLEIERRR